MAIKIIYADWYRHHKLPKRYYRDMGKNQLPGARERFIFTASRARFARRIDEFNRVLKMMLAT